MSTPDRPTREEVITSSNERRFALVVGVNNSITPNAREVLHYPEQDASEMAWALQELYCNFTVKALRGQDAVTWNVKKEIIDLAKGKTSEDFLLFYFSGHAYPMETSGGHRDIYLVTHDFSEDDEIVAPGTHLSIRWLKKVLYEHAQARAVLLILDCCYAGNIVHTGPDPYLFDFGKLMEEWLEEGSAGTRKDVPRAILTATGYNITAQEKDGHGRMTHWLLRALRGDDKVDTNGQVDLHALHKYLKMKIPEQQPNLAGEFGQYPWILASHPRNILTALDRRYLETHQQLPFDHSLCYGASFADLDPRQVKAFSQQERVQHAEVFQPGIADEELFERFQLLEQGHPTYGALLCFGQRPLALVPGAMTRCVRWNGIKRGNTLDIWEYSGSLLRQFELSRNFLQKNLGLRRVINREGLERTTEEWEIPFRALEEALANALVHREYLNRMDNIYVEVYDDRVEITSPGTLPSSMSVDQLLNKHDSLPRNPQIAGIFFLYRYIEKFGTGIERMADFMKESGLPEPQFRINEPEKRFTVILHRPIELQQSIPAKQAEAPLPAEQPPVAEPVEASQTIWNVPRRNPFFTGREHLLSQARQQLTSARSAALSQTQAINGLGGIGKTQTAIEYAHRYRDEYHAIFWVSAASKESLQNDFTKLASLLNLPEKDERDQNVTLAAVQRWLAQQEGWLLILDNADDPAMLDDFLPFAGPPNGHILITTRTQAPGVLTSTAPISVEEMEHEEGTLLLLRRARLLAPDAPLSEATSEDRVQAEAIVNALDGLPLALDQAGAYIEETGCGLADYLALYQSRRKDLLSWLSNLPSNRPQPVSTAWDISFQKVAEANAAAVDLLCLCSFLDPDSIPEELFSIGASALGLTLEPVASDPFKLNEVIEALRRYSLIRRDRATRTLTIHRLVQAVLIDRMDAETQRQWAEHAVCAVNKAFSYELDDYKTWSLCKRLLPQAQACSALVEQYHLVFGEAANLLNNVAQYLQDQGQYTQALPLFQRSLDIRKEILGPEHPDVAQSLNNLARLYDVLGLYAEAEPLYQRALAIYERTLGSEHPDVAQSLNNLARLYDALGLYAKAEPLYQRALMIDEKILGPQHPDVAIDLNNLALLYYYQGQYTKAEPLYQRALMIDERALGMEHPEVATDLHNLASLYQAQSKYMMAEALFKQAVTLREKSLGLEHPDLAASLHNLAKVYELRGNYEQAEELYRKVLAIFEKALGREHPNVATVSANYAGLLQKIGRTIEADKLEERSREVQVKYVEENENPS